MLGKCVALPTAFALTLVSSATALAWNGAGHRVVATIAYRELDEATRGRVVDLLKRHPAADTLWATHENNGPDDGLNLFMNAAIFPDDARSPGPFRKFHRSRAHFVNFRIMADRGNLVLSPLPGENVLNSYAAHSQKIEAGRRSVGERALSLSWVFHQAGDIHQPLHAVARFSRAFPDGDRGGNAVDVPGPDGRTNLHSYWDGLLGKDERPDSIDGLATSLVMEHPRSSFDDEELALDDIGDWAQESIALAKSRVYRNLDPEIERFADLPVGYEAEAKRAARRRVALAGYRLADQLKSLFPPED